MLQAIKEEICIFLRLLGAKQNHLAAVNLQSFTNTLSISHLKHCIVHSTVMSTGTSTEDDSTGGRSSTGTIVSENRKYDMVSFLSL
jgi:hypothetical protein